MEGKGCPRIPVQGVGETLCKKILPLISGTHQHCFVKGTGESHGEDGLRSEETGKRGYPSGRTD